MLDFSFDHLITTKMIKMIYLLAVGGISIVCLVVAWYGWAFLAWNTTLGVMTLIAAPLLWISWTVFTRVVLEFLINQFKIAEHLRVIRDKL